MRLPIPSLAVIAVAVMTVTAPPATAAMRGVATVGAAAAVDPCSLLRQAEVAKIAPGVRRGKRDRIGGGVVLVCGWPDAHGVPEVTLQVVPHLSTSLRANLAGQFVGMKGYTIVAVHGVGQEAAAAFLKGAGLVILEARSGRNAIALSTPRVPQAIVKGSRRFTLVERLAATALARLGGQK
jgi:hypothetical protein